jgi:hypothetical protein
MCTPVNTLTFSGSITVNGQTRTVSNQQLIPAGVKNCIARTGDSLKITTTTQQGTFINTLQARGDTVKGSMSLGSIKVQIDGRGVFA